MNLLFYHIKIQSVWIIREQYKSCLSDFDYLTDSDIMQIRDNLLKKTAEIYKSALPTEYSHVKAPAISARAPVPVTTSAPLEF